MSVIIVLLLTGSHSTMPCTMPAITASHTDDINHSSGSASETQVGRPALDGRLRPPCARMCHTACEGNFLGSVGAVNLTAGLSRFLGASIFNASHVLAIVRSWTAFLFIGPEEGRLIVGFWTVRCPAARLSNTAARVVSGGLSPIPLKARADQN